MIQIYTGNGKGKTTAALGLALRAVGHGLKVIMIQFMKGRINYGELEAAKSLPGFTIEQYGRPDFVNPEQPDKEDVRLAQEGLQRAQEVLKSGAYDIVILDEIIVAVSFGLITVREVIDLIKRAAADTELILTGRYMPPELGQYADLISEIRETKHYFQKGTKSRPGIDY
ncbi:cob(I)yrinic acid a,c-diamide adenosyltransferase [candidate division WOR_3 bacterium SM23_60]|uniref:Cob(I)yrinic acid a,c-diamide adenosyltransferase n=1 Tax=candidate division WOR_3 bacterium SM23_60 TaxID=1703780 RepID=A0A0S8GCL4_UNCW3|nr:MAG: cob(I)yrinic acid a,c-diamide adenosyltransferase [candidate division WOR_3 bacterium SM23_60]